MSQDSFFEAMRPRQPGLEFTHSPGSSISIPASAAERAAARQGFLQQLAREDSSYVLQYVGADGMQTAEEEPRDIIEYLQWRVNLVAARVLKQYRTYAETYAQRKE